MMFLSDVITKGVLDAANEHEISLKLFNTWEPVTLWYQPCRTILQGSSFEPFLQGNRMSDKISRNVVVCDGDGGKKLFCRRQLSAPVHILLNNLVERNLGSVGGVTILVPRT